jgi:glycosyltransferase involved in cell wall biosynthesis
MTHVRLVSVLLPVRDGAQYLGKALDSLAAQTVEDFEVIVVDDGSLDGSAELAEGRGRFDSRFRTVRQARLGLVAALERARELARGRFLARMDADDICVPRRLEAQLEALAADPSLAACGGRVEFFPRETLRDGMRRYEEWVNGLVTPALAAADAFVECPIPHPTLLIRREALERAGGYRDRGWPEDYDLVLRLLRHRLPFRNVEEVVLRWRDHPGRLSRRDGAYSAEAFLRCKLHHLRATLLHDGDGVVVWGAGPVGKAFARELARQGVPIRAFVEVDPRKIGKRIAGAPVVSIDGSTAFVGGLAVGAVAGAEARRRIREAVAAQGRRDGIDFVAVA